MRHIPNLLTSLRIVLAFLFPLSASEYHVWILSVALATEFLDGFLARRFGWTTQLGKVLDPIADKVFFLSVAISYLLGNRLTTLELVTVGFRDIAVTAGVLLIVTLNKHSHFHKMEPTLAGKMTTCAQYVVLFTLALGFELPVFLSAGVFLLGAFAAGQYLLLFNRH